VINLKGEIKIIKNPAFLEWMWGTGGFINVEL
jgi:hypothetical protein